jgi:putative Mg2+ transporter-C (MgtC) family protein
MPLSPDWIDIGARLLLTVFVCGALGLDRGESAKPVGARTVALVGLAAALSMITANLLLTTVGKTEASFARMDVMRLPLGILTGIGFIGAGVIIKRGSSVEGVTTAATIWLATMLGIVFGAGLFVLGIVSAAAAAVILVVVKPLERQVEQRKGLLRIVANETPTLPADLGGITLNLRRVLRTADQTELEFHAAWPGSLPRGRLEAVVADLGRMETVREVEFRL